MIRFPAFGYLAVLLSAIAPVAFAQADAHGVIYATNYSNIAAAITACGTTNPCTVVIPPAFGAGGVPGSFANPAFAQPNTGGQGTQGSIPANVSVIDQRGGGAGTLQNNENYVGNNVTSGTLLNCNHSNPVASGIGNVFCDSILQSANDGGTNYNYGNANLPTNLTNWSALVGGLFASTEGQAIGVSASSTHNGLGDTLGMSVQGHCHGGFVATTDEGCEAMDLQVFQSGADTSAMDYQGMVTAGGSGVTVVTLSSTQGEGTQGAGRYLLLTQGVSPSSSLLTSVVLPPAIPPPPMLQANPESFIITGASTLPVSTTSATLNNPGTGIPAGSPATVTPHFNTGSMSLITTSTLLCIADPLGPLEFVKPTLVSGTTMRIQTTRPHAASAIITSGGVCGSFIDLTADHVTSATFPGIGKITGTMLHAWPILETFAPSGSGAGTTQQVYVAIQRNGAWGDSLSQYKSTTGAFSIYPGAEVYSVANSQGEQSDTFTLSPNNVNWANGASVDLPDHPAVNVAIGQWLTQQEFPGNYGGFGISYYGPITGGNLAGFMNFAPKNLYTNEGGALSPPYGVKLGGSVLYDFYADTGGAQGDILLGCSATCNNPFEYVLTVGEAGGHNDSLLMDENVGQWQLTTNHGGFNYFFRKDGLEQPTTVVAAAADSGFAKLNFNSSYQVCLMDPAGTNHCSTTSGSTNATSIQNIPVSTTAPTTNQVLAYNGSQYAPTTLPSATGNVMGPASSNGNDIVTFNGTTGTSIQDSGVNIGPFLSGVWINLPTSGPSAIGTGGVGSNPLLGYSRANGNYFTDAAAGDLSLRDAPGQTIRIGINNSANNPPSTLAVSSSQVTLNLGVKLTGTHGISSSAAPTGIATLSGGHVTVSTTSILALASSGGSGDAVELTLQNCFSCGILSVGTVVPTTSFVINSSNSADGSNVFWNIRHIN